jgi:hypothetical protein
VGVYHREAGSESYLPFALDVLTLDGSRIGEVTAFIVRTTDLDDSEFARWPEKASDAAMVESVFVRCGLPARLD